MVLAGEAWHKAPQEPGAGTQFMVVGSCIPSGLTEALALVLVVVAVAVFVAARLPAIFQAH